uniref:Uncharacterized protein n=1 Tax=Tetraselmis sp. GSL018 TaxID=582737 RepID=A0A061REZ5_9CHLO
MAGSISAFGWPEDRHVAPSRNPPSHAQHSGAGLSSGRRLHGSSVPKDPRWNKMGQPNAERICCRADWRVIKAQIKAHDAGSQQLLTQLAKLMREQGNRMAGPYHAKRLCGPAQHQRWERPRNRRCTATLHCQRPIPTMQQTVPIVVSGHRWIAGSLHQPRGDHMQMWWAGQPRALERDTSHLQARGCLQHSNSISCRFWPEEGSAS